MDSGHKNKENVFLSEVSTTIFKDFMRCRRFPYMHVVLIDVLRIGIKLRYMIEYRCTGEQKMKRLSRLFIQRMLKK